MATSYEIYRALHIAFAAFWVGGGIFWFMVMHPVMRRDDGVAKAVMARAVHGPFFGLTTLFTVVFGLLTFIQLGAPAFSGAAGMVFNIGMGLGILGFLVGWGGHFPAGIKAKKAVQAGDDVAFGAAFRRDVMLGRVSAGLVTGALLAMTMYRFF